VTDPEPLSQAEWIEFRLLLRRFCAWDLDQWVAWQTQTPYGPVYVRIDRELVDGSAPELFVSLDRDEGTTE
jgi:hypothetical protein